LLDSKARVSRRILEESRRCQKPILQVVSVYEHPNQELPMKTLPTFVLLSLCLASCATKTETETSSTVARTSEDSAARSGEEPLIASASFAVGGGMIGPALDDSDSETLKEQNPKTYWKIYYSDQLNVVDIKNMSLAKLNDDTIIGQIESTGSQFHLTTSDIVQLQNAHVSQRVIDAMIRSGSPEDI
jgi:hypothetical protein